MTVLGRLDRFPIYGSVHMRHAIAEDLSAPGADTTVPAGGTVDVTINVAGEVPRDILYAGVEKVSGLPSGVYIAGISFDKKNKKLTITLYNSTGSDVTVSAGSLTVTVVCIA